MYLERLARDLKGSGAVMQPFPADVEKTRDDVRSKDWTDAELSEVRRVPSLLVINKDFDEFSPRADSWILFHFGERNFGGHEGLARLDEVIRTITSVALDANSSVGELLTLSRSMAGSRIKASKIFEAKPGAFGLSVNLLEGWKELSGWLRAHRTSRGAVRESEA